MARVKRGTKARKRRKKTLDLAEGFYGRRKNCFTIATVAVDHALAYAFVGRKQKKRDLRALWIQRLNAASRKCGVSYSKLIPMLRKAKIELDRKILADIAVKDFGTFTKIVETAKAAV